MSGFCTYCESAFSVTWFVLANVGLGLDHEVNFAGISVAIKVWVGCSEG